MLTGQQIADAIAKLQTSGGLPAHTHVEADVANLLVDLAARLTDPTTTKGDLVTRTGVAATRLGVGGDTFVLTADSAQPTGLKWAAAPTTPAPTFAALEKYRVD